MTAGPVVAYNVLFLLAPVQSLYRNARERGVLDYDVDVQQDAWYFVEDPTTFQNNRSVEVYVLDVSGSMRGEYLSLVRKTIFILWHYLERRYPTNLRRYVVFQDVAEEKTRDEFFCVESSGGTHISTGFEKAVELLEGAREYDKFLFMFTDGETSSATSASRRSGSTKLGPRSTWSSTATSTSAGGASAGSMQETAKAQEGAAFANLMDLETIRGAMRDFLAFFDAQDAGDRPGSV